MRGKWPPHLPWTALSGCTARLWLPANSAAGSQSLDRYRVLICRGKTEFFGRRVMLSDAGSQIYKLLGWRSCTCCLASIQLRSVIHCLPALLQEWPKACLSSCRGRSRCVLQRQTGRLADPSKSLETPISGVTRSAVPEVTATRSATSLSVLEALYAKVSGRCPPVRGEPPEHAGCASPCLAASRTPTGPADGGESAEQPQS